MSVCYHMHFQSEIASMVSSILFLQVRAKEHLADKKKKPSKMYCILK